MDSKKTVEETIQTWEAERENEIYKNILKESEIYTLIRAYCYTDHSYYRINDFGKIDLFEINNKQIYYFYYKHSEKNIKYIAILDNIAQTCNIVNTKFYEVNNKYNEYKFSLIQQLFSLLKPNNIEKPIFILKGKRKISLFKKESKVFCIDLNIENKKIKYKNNNELIVYTDKFLFKINNSDFLYKITKNNKLVETKYDIYEYDIFTRENLNTYLGYDTSLPSYSK